MRLQTAHAAARRHRLEVLGPAAARAKALKLQGLRNIDILRTLHAEGFTSLTGAQLQEPHIPRLLKLADLDS